MSDWWKAIEDELDRRSEVGDDPWADLFHDDVELSEAQVEFLSGFDDQPVVSRFTVSDHDAMLDLLDVDDLGDLGHLGDVETDG